MEEVYFRDINFKEEGVIQDKIIKGNILFNDFDFYQANFVNCEFNNITFVSNTKRAITYFQFTKCKINRIDINCFVDHICINDSEVHVLKQENGETRFIEIFCDEAEKNFMNYLMLFNSTSQQLSIKNYRINTLYLRGLKVLQSLTIDNVIVIQNFSIIGCFIKDGNILNTICKSDFSLANFELDTELYLGYLDCNRVRFNNKLRNLNLILSNIKCKYIRFQNFDVINSTFKLDKISVSEELLMLESDFGNSYFVDCNFTKCRISISFPILTSIKSLNLNFSNNVNYYNQFGDATKEKEITEIAEFYRQLKFNAISQDNHYTALEYYSKEMNCYFTSLKNLNDFSYKLGGKNKFINLLLKWTFEWIYDFYDLVIHSIFKSKNPFEGFRVWVFKYTNNFGLDWVRPAIIYVIVSYLLFVIANDDYSFTLSLKFSALIEPNFPQFLNPINKFSFSEITNQKTFKTSLVELIAIITQGFLIYQIIRGFRKYVLK
jgi:hypothetical protein